MENAHQVSAVQEIAMIRKQMKHFVERLTGIARVDDKRDVVVDTAGFAPFRQLFPFMSAMNQSAFLNALGHVNKHAEMLVIDKFLDKDTLKSVRFPKALAYHLRRYFPEEGLLHLMGNAPADKTVYVIPNTRAYRRVLRALGDEHTHRHGHDAAHAATPLRCQDFQKQM